MSSAFLIILLSLLIRYQPYVILSGSMRPTFDTGAIIILDTWNKHPKKGDIASYNGSGLEYNKPSITHRVVKVSKKGYTFKGDFNPIADSNVISQKRIQGTVVLYENFTCSYLCPVIIHGVRYLMANGPFPRSVLTYGKLIGRK